MLKILAVSFIVGFSSFGTALASSCCDSCPNCEQCPDCPDCPNCDNCC